MSRDPRRPGEKWFELMERTTHPSAWMHVISGRVECCDSLDPWSAADIERSNRAHRAPELFGKEQ